jgi:hypothetical protein
VKRQKINNGKVILTNQSNKINIHKQTNTSLSFSIEESEEMEPRGRSTASTTHETLAPNSMKVF